MPWFDPPASFAERDIWAFPDGFGPHKVAKWPAPNSNRSKCGFRLRDTVGLYPTYSRFFCGFGYNQQLTEIPPFPRQLDINGWHDLDVVVAGEHLQAIRGVSPEGFNVQQDITWFDSLPVEGTEGIEFKLRVEAFGEYYQESWEWTAANPFSTRWTYDKLDLVGGINFTVDQSPGWLPRGNAFYFFRVSDCFDFIRIGAPVVGATMLTNQEIASNNDSFSDVTIPAGIKVLRGYLRLRGGTAGFNGVGIQLGRSGVVDVGAADYRWKNANYATAGAFFDWNDNFTFAIDRGALVPAVGDTVNKWFVGEFSIIGVEDGHETVIHSLCGGSGGTNRYCVLLGYHKFESAVDILRIHDYLLSAGWAHGSKLQIVGFD